MYRPGWIDAVVMSLDLSRRDHLHLFFDCATAGESRATTLSEERLYVGVVLPRPRVA